MKREIERERDLPAFKVDLVELALLWKRLLVLFDHNDPPYASITLKRNKSETLVFDSVDEVLESGVPLSGSFDDFSLYLSRNGRTIRVYTSGSLVNRSVVHASGDDEAWCAGAVEVVVSFLHNHRCWYDKLISFPFGVVLMIFANVPPILQLISKEKFDVSISVWLTWYLLLAVFVALTLFKGKFFPAARITVTRHEPFIKRYSTELTLLISVFAAVVALLSWLLPTK